MDWEGSNGRSPESVSPRRISDRDRTRLGHIAHEHGPDDPVA